jgi:hypothetical protein
MSKRVSECVCALVWKPRRGKAKGEGREIVRGGLIW